MAGQNEHDGLRSAFGRKRCKLGGLGERVTEPKRSYIASDLRTAWRSNSRSTKWTLLSEPQVRPQGASRFTGRTRAGLKCPAMLHPFPFGLRVRAGRGPRKANGRTLTLTSASVLRSSSRIVSWSRRPVKSPAPANPIPEIARSHDRNSTPN
jgi:hypothetical protein